MADLTEFYSIWPNLSGRQNKKRRSRFDMDPKLVLIDEVENATFNTNAKAAVTTTSPDRLKKMFADRQSHRALAEQKVSDWLLKYRSYTHIPPKDMNDIPDTIWAPLDIDHSSKNNAANDFDRVARKLSNGSRGRPLKVISSSQTKRTTDENGNHPYFFAPPYKESKVSEPNSQRRKHNYMDISRGLLRGSKFTL